MPLRTRRTDGAAPLDGVDLLLFDLDGVVYAGHHAIPHAVESITRAQEAMRVGYLTNNAARTDVAVAEQLSGFGLRVAPDDIVTSPQAAVVLLADRVPAGATGTVCLPDGSPERAIGPGTHSFTTTLNTTAPFAA